MAICCGGWCFIYQYSCGVWRPTYLNPTFLPELAFRIYLQLSCLLCYTPRPLVKNLSHWFPLAAPSLKTILWLVPFQTVSWIIAWAPPGLTFMRLTFKASSKRVGTQVLYRQNDPYTIGSILCNYIMKLSDLMQLHAHDAGNHFEWKNLSRAKKRNFVCFSQSA